MSKHLVELCTLLVDEAFGELASRVFSTLVIHGRLTLSPLSARSGLSLRYTKHGLCVLIQQCLVHYNTSEDDSITYYEADVGKAYDIVRLGKTVKQVEDQFGKDAADLVSVLQHHGYAVAEEILNEQAVPTEGDGLGAEVNGDGPPNGPAHNHVNVTHDARARGTRREACEQLFSASYALRLSQDDFLSASDFHESVERKVKWDYFGGDVKGTKQTAEFRKEVTKRKRQILEDHAANVRELKVEARTAPGKRALSADVDDEQAVTGKLQNSSVGHPSKKRKVENGITSVDTGHVQKASHAEAITSEPAYRLNREKLNVSFRNQRLTDLSARSLGLATSQVYNTLLRQLERNIPRCHDEYAETVDNDKEEGDYVGGDSDEDEERKAFITTTDVEKHLDRSIDVQSTFVEKPKVKIEPGKKGDFNDHPHEHDSLVNGVSTHHDDNPMLSTQKRVGFVEQHLRLLAQHSQKFVSRISPAGQGTWKVDFQALTRSIIQIELESVLAARFGPNAIRIVRILHGHGKLDEKQLGQMGLMRQKDLRRVLTAMQEAGYVDTQEVPRDNTRQPSRTIYLWFYDHDRCRKLILNDLYKSMSRLLQRAKVEKQKVQTVVDKAERTDVKGQEDKYLSKAEQDALADWRDREEKILVQLSREDDLVALLRDFMPQKT